MDGSHVYNSQLKDDPPLRRKASSARLRAGSHDVYLGPQAIKRHDLRRDLAHD
jgi:hypothetical protein